MNKYCILLLMSLFSFFISSEEVFERYIDEANRLYIQGDFEGAFTQINHYLFVAEDVVKVDRVYILGEKIYYYYIRSLFSSDDFFGTSYIEKSISENIQLKSTRVQNALDLLKDNGDIPTNKSVEPVQEILEEDTPKESSRSEYSRDELTLLLKNSLLEGQKSSKQVSNVTLLLTLLIIFIFIAMVSLAIYIFIMFSTRKKSLLNNRNNLSPTLIGISDSSVQDFDNLLSDCKKVGVSIDLATGRKNNALNSAELVYKISIENGYTEKESLLFFAATLVYDIGLLGIESSILQRDTISAQEFEEIKKHVKYGETSLTFIPENYKSLFYDAVTKHHENLDGSGYPAGLTDVDIPYIARVLRVVESYLSQVSSRGYKVISDKETAIKHLKNEPEVYDLKIVESLDRVN